MSHSKGLISGFFTPILSFFFIKKEFRIVLPLFYFYTGLSIVLVKSGDYSNSDINRTIERYSNFSGNSFSNNFNDLYAELISFSKVDFGDSLIYSLLSLFDTQPYLIIPIIALFQGILMVQVFKNIESLGLLNYVLIFFLVLILNPFSCVNQFRFYTASILLINGFLLQNKNSIFCWYYYIGAVCFHFSLVIFLPFFLIKISSMKIYRILILILIMSYFVSSVEYLGNFLRQFLFGEFFNRVDSYTGEIGQGIIDNKLNKVWYVSWREISYYALQLVLIIPLLYELKKKYIKLFSTLVIICIILNTISSFSMFFRFAMIVLVMLVILFFLTKKYYKIYTGFKIYVFSIMFFAGVMAISILRFFLRDRFLISNIFVEIFQL